MFIIWLNYYVVVEIHSMYVTITLMRVLGIALFCFANIFIYLDNTITLTI